MSETSDTGRDSLELDVAHRERSKTWPTGIPALRLYRRQRTLALPPELAGASAAAPAPVEPPRLLRAKRALAGLVLLALAWLGLFVVALLSMDAWHVLPVQRLSFGLLVAALEVVGACWIGLAALGCLFVGSFCVMLALTRREW